MKLRRGSNGMREQPGRRWVERETQATDWARIQSALQGTTTFPLVGITSSVYRLLAHDAPALSLLMRPPKARK